MSKSHSTVQNNQRDFYDRTESREEMFAKIFKRPSNSSIADNSPIDPNNYTGERALEKLQKMRESADDRMFAMYEKMNHKPLDTEDNLYTKAGNNFGANAIDPKTYQSKLLQRLDNARDLFVDTISKLGQTHPELLIKNSTFGGIVMNPTDNLNSLFNKMSNRTIALSSTKDDGILAKVDDINFSMPSESIISSKMSGLTYNMNVERMSELMSELILENKIDFSFDTPSLLSLSDKSYVVPNVRQILSLYNKENIEYVFNSKFIDNSYNTMHSTVNYFKDTYADGFIEKARELNTFFKNLNNTAIKEPVDYLSNEYASGFTPNSVSLYSHYKNADGVELGNITELSRDVGFSNKTSILSAVDYLNNTYAEGFTTRSIPLFSQYRRSDQDSALGIITGEFQASFGNDTSKLTNVDYLSNRYAYGFVSGIEKLYSLFNNSKDGKSRSDIGYGINIKNNITPEVNANWFLDEYAKGFVTNSVPMYSYFMDISRNLLGKDPYNQAVMFKNETSWLKVQNNFSDEHADGFDTNSRFMYSYYKMKNGKRLGILNQNIVGFFDEEYTYPGAEFPQRSDYKEFNWNYVRNSLMDDNILVNGGVNFFPNLHNSGFVVNKKFGESDFTNYDTKQTTYSDFIISNIFETLDLESKINTNISAVNYFNDTYARGFILNSDLKYSYMQYKIRGRSMDIGILGTDTQYDTKFDDYITYPQKFIEIRSNSYDGYAEKISMFKYNNNSGFVILPNNGVDTFSDNLNSFYTSGRSSNMIENFTKDYTLVKFPGITTRFDYNAERTEETAWSDLQSKYYGKLIKKTYESNKIPIYNFQTDNYIGTLANTIVAMKDAYAKYGNGDLGKFSLTRGFSESNAVQLYKAYDNVDTRLLQKGYVPLTQEELIRENKAGNFDAYGNPYVWEIDVFGGNSTSQYFDKVSNSGFEIANSAYVSRNRTIPSPDQSETNIYKLIDVNNSDFLRDAQIGLQNSAIDTLMSLIGLDTKFRQSPLIFQTMAGYIYKALTESLPIVGSVGTGLQKVSGLVSDITGQDVGNLINSPVNDIIKRSTDELKNQLDLDSIVKLGRIILGDKYTKSYSFYDEELAKYGNYGTPSNNPMSTDSIGFVGNRKNDAATRGDTKSMTSDNGFGEIVSSLQNRFNSIFNPLGVADITDKNDSLRNRIQMRRNGSAVNLYNSSVGNTYPDMLKNQLDGKTKDLSIIHDHGKSRGNSVFGTKGPNNTDLIDFYFTIENYKVDDKDEPKYMHFRADIKNIPNSVNSEWNAISYVGRPDKFYIYQGFERKSGVEFTIAADNKKQLKVMWDKINLLMGMCMPISYSNGISMIPAIIKCTIGGVVNDRYIIVNSVTTNIDPTYPWDIDEQLPQILDVTMDFSILYDELPKMVLDGNVAKWHISKAYNTTEIKI